MGGGRKEREKKEKKLHWSIPLRGREIAMKSAREFNSILGVEKSWKDPTDDFIQLDNSIIIDSLVEIDQ